MAVGQNVANLLVSIGADIKGLEKGLSKAQRKIQDAGRSMKRVGGTLTRNVTAPLALIGGAAIKAAGDFESSFADIRKTVTATEPEFAQMSSEIRELAKTIPTSVNELNKLGGVAGQLGVEADNIVEFTKTMAMLGDTTDIAGEQAALSLSRFMNVMGTAPGDIDRLGSTIVGLGNNFAAMESEIVEIGTSLAPLGNSIGLTEQQVLAFSTAIAASGGKTEAASTAFQKTASSMKQAVISGGKDLEKFAKITGQSADEFQQSFKKDASGAILDFLEGLGRIQKEGGSTASVLEDLGLADQRLQREFGKLTGNIDQARKAVGVSNDAFERNTALTEEAQKRYATFNSRVKILWNNLYDLRVQISNGLMPAVNSLIDGSKSLIGWFSDLSDNTKKWLAVTATIAAVIGPVIYAIGAMVTAVSSLATAYLFLSGTAIPAVIASFSTLSAAVLANPVLAAALGIAAAFVVLRQSIINATARQKRLNEEISKLADFDVDTASLTDLETQLGSLQGKLDDVKESGAPLAWIPYLGADYEEIQQLNKLIDETKTKLDSIKPVGIFKTSQMMTDDSFGDLLNPKDPGPQIFRREVDVKTDTGGGGGPQIPVTPFIEPMAPGSWEPILEELDIPKIEMDLGFPAGSIGYVQTRIQELNDAITQSASQSERDQLASQRATLQAKLDNMRTYAEQASNTVIAFTQITQEITTQFTSSFGQGMANIIVQGERVVDVLSNIGRLLASSVIQSGLKLLLSGGISGIGGFFGGGGGLFGAIGGLFGLAEGGLAFGPTMAVVGDNKGARSNPEVIAPLDKLKSMMGEMGGTQRVIVEGKIRGSDIFVSNQRGKRRFR